MSSRSQLFVGRLPIDIREKDVEQVFEQYGRLLRCDVKYGMFGSTGRRGSGRTGMAYAFVDYDDRRDAEDAIKYENGREIKGQSIVVEWARGPSYRSRRESYGGHLARTVKNVTVVVEQGIGHEIVLIKIDTIHVPPGIVLVQGLGRDHIDLGHIVTGVVCPAVVQEVMIAAEEVYLVIVRKVEVSRSRSVEKRRKSEKAKKKPRTPSKSLSRSRSPQSKSRSRSASVNRKDNRSSPKTPENYDYENKRVATPEFEKDRSQTRSPRKSSSRSLSKEKTRLYDNDSDRSVSRSKSR
ncbi:uncharacterized protein CEXT_645411 [Caerostris extrusa]|uniref:RRM domain-containing protein n=1 Tax=Caerostris extrusa TaxID=172846 RepID=A0AAV4XVS4_CAEEX|nr:uncharacterized protein CEXT_645411 [Caerostris extrusa]